MVNAVLFSGVKSLAYMLGHQKYHTRKSENLKCSTMKPRLEQTNEYNQNQLTLWCKKNKNCSFIIALVSSSTGEGTIVAVATVETSYSACNARHHPYDAVPVHHHGDSAGYRGGNWHSLQRGIICRSCWLLPNLPSPTCQTY